LADDSMLRVAPLQQAEEDARIGEAWHQSWSA
jgi:hypothetical protein